MDDRQLREEVVEAAMAWAHAKREWEAGSRETSRPANYGELKGNIRKAERTLMNKIQALEQLSEPEEAPTPPGAEPPGYTPAA